MSDVTGFVTEDTTTDYRIEPTGDPVLEELDGRARDAQFTMVGTGTTFERVGREP